MEQLKYEFAPLGLVSFTKVGMRRFAAYRTYA
jgi:hypothetical protein